MTRYQFIGERGAAKENYKSKRIKGEHSEEPNPQSITLKSFDDAAKLIKGLDTRKQKSGAETEDGLRSKAPYLSEKLNTPVTLITTRMEVVSLPSRNRRRAKGWWNSREGVVIVKNADEPGAYNLVEVYSNVKGTLTSKTFYKTRKDATQGAMSLKKSPHFTSVTEEAILSGTKLPKFFEYPAIEGENKDETYFRDGNMSLEEAITRMKAEALAANTDNLQAKRDAMRAIGGNLNHLRQAMAQQREYDIQTVKSVTDLARTLLKNGLLDEISKFEVERILGAVTNVEDKQDVSKQVQKVLDIMVDNQLRTPKSLTEQFFLFYCVTCLSYILVYLN